MRFLNRGRKRALPTENKHDLKADFKFPTLASVVHFRHCLSRRTRYHVATTGRQLWEERYVRRMWPDEYAFLLDGAEEVDLHIPPVARDDGSTGKATTRKALRARISQENFEKIWSLAEARYRLDGKFTGKAITLITNNPHYKEWHPADGGAVEGVADSGHKYSTRYVIVHFLLDDVSEPVEA